MGSGEIHFLLLRIVIQCKLECSFISLWPPVIHQELFECKHNRTCENFMGWNNGSLYDARKRLNVLF